MAALLIIEEMLKQVQHDGEKKYFEGKTIK